MRILLSALSAALIFSNTMTYGMPHQHNMHEQQLDQNEIKLVLDNAPKEIIADKSLTIRFQLLQEQKPLTSADLKKVHTEKIHVMLIDPTLTNYYHIHPQFDAQKNDYFFTYTPQKSSAYQMWVDVTPITTNKQQFLSADIGTPFIKHSIDTKVNLENSLNDYQFKLQLDEQPKVDNPVMGSITITHAGKLFNQLQPLMGSFMHLVGFYANDNGILHIHPMGSEPSNPNERGGPTLMFHIEPKNAGFVKLFAQFRINGKDVYVPFGIVVKP